MTRTQSDGRLSSRGPTSSSAPHPPAAQLPVEGMMPLLYGATGWANTEAFSPGTG